MAVLGQDSGSYTPQDVERKRRWAEILLKGQKTAKEPFGALAQGLRGALAGWNDFEAGKAESEGRNTVAELLKSGDWKGALGSEWASPQQSAMASMLLGRDWQVADQQANWAREDARAARSEALQRELASKPEYGFETVNGDLIAFDKRNPGGGFQTIYDGQPQAPDPTSLMQNLEAAGIQPGSTEFKNAVLKSLGGSNVNVNNMGNIPAGYQLQYDEAGNPTSMSPIPGSPAALEAEKASTQLQLQADQKEKTGNIVVEDVGRAIDLIKKDPTFTTGIGGKMLAGVGGTNANSVSELVKTIKANSAFDQLQAMRAASPTGGALGAVSDTEMGLLQAAIGSLEQSQNAEQLTYNLKRVQGIYNEIVNGPGAKVPEQGNWTDLGNGIRIREK